MQSHSEIYRFSMETVPFGIEEFPDSQPVLLLLLNETHGLVIGMELMAEAPDVARAGEWILRQLEGSADFDRESGTPALLQVEDAELYQALRFRLRRAGLKVQHSQDRQLVESILNELYQGLGSSHQPASLIQVLGEEEALDWARAALYFCRKQPWKVFQRVLECQVPGRAEPYGVYVLGSGGSEFGLLLLENPSQPLIPAPGEHLAFLLGFSLSPEAMIHPQDLALFQAYRLKKARRGWPHFIFSEPCSDEDEAVFRWLLTAVPQLAQTPLDPYCDESRFFVLRDPGARQRDDWESFEAYSKSFQSGRLTNARRELLEVLHEFLLHSKYEEGLEMAELLADCRILARLLWNEKPANWRKRLSEGAFPAAGGSESKSLADTWDMLGRYLKTQEIYFGPSVPLLLLGAELAKVRQEEGWQERLAVSQDMAGSALEGISGHERALVVETWRRWMKELSEKYLDRESLFLEPQEMNRARAAAEQFMHQLEAD